MAQATNEPTAPAAEAHPDLRKIVYDAEDDLHCACDYVQSAAMMVEGRGPISEKKRSAVIRLISDAHDKMKIVREACERCMR